LTQQQLASKVLLNQKDISDLECGRPYAVRRWRDDHDRFRSLKELIEGSRRRETRLLFPDLKGAMDEFRKREPIEIFHRSALPDRFNIETDHCAEWIAVTPESRLLECRSLFADRDDVAIVTKVD
jgi:hypothetical protein